MRRAAVVAFALALFALYLMSTRVDAGTPFVLFLPYVPLQPSSTPTPTATATNTPTPSAGQFGYGMSLNDFGQVNVLKQTGFRYVKGYVSWASLESSPQQYSWGAVDSLMSVAAQSGLFLILRVDTPPDWETPGSGNRPPANASDFGRFMGALASHARGQIWAYEIWNEPNLSGEWGNQRPNPTAYAALLQAAYPQIKAADPGATVITAGLATTGGDGGVTSMNDCDFIQGMYNAGAKGYFDALGSHPYGFGTSPTTKNSNGITDFRRPEDQYAVMVANGDANKTIVATEFGWLLDPTYYGHPEYLNDPLWSGRQWQIQSPENQSAYLVQAYQYAFANWPWMGPMLLFNLDFSETCSCQPQDPMRFYSIVNSDRSPRPAYTALSQMAKPIR
jgi:polysaccharide biosynthesis protein PslG